MTADANAAVAHAFRDDWGRIVATLIRMTGDWDLAEECAQDAFAVALRHWPSDGVPRRPGAWLTTVARRRALDRLRRSAIEVTKLKKVASMLPGGDEAAAESADSGIGDDRLRLMFTCCHPALPLESRVALTLRTLAGLTTAEIATAFLVPEPTMAKRLVRAKHKIRHAAIPFRVPPAELRPARLTGVLAVLYLLFNEGYTSSGGTDLIRESLCSEAIHLTRALTQLMPDEPEPAALLALMGFQHSRRFARVDASGDLITLADQDRTLWVREEIEDADAMLARARRGPPGRPYLLQAAIARCHAEAAVAADTDWPEIARLYGQLAHIMPSPIVELNRAVAVAMADGPAAGLAVIAALVDSGALQQFYLLHATKADLLRRLGRTAEAADSYREALALAHNDPERRYLIRRLAESADVNPDRRP